MIGLILTTSVLLSTTIHSELNAEQFDQVIKELHSKVKDITFYFEGTSDFIGPKEALKPGHRPFHEAFQGTYSHRNDGATWLDVYHYYEDASTAYHHDTRVSYKGVEQSLSRVPDFGKSPTKPKIGFGYPGCLNDEDSPEGMIYYWLFQDTKNYTKFGFENLGWEDIDGHKCLKIQLNIVPGSRNGGEPYHRYWIDMERGGHPVMIERYENNTFVYRTKVELARVDSPSTGPIWLPRSAELLSYFWEGKSYSFPVVKTTYVRVNGSSVMNQGLQDDYFSVDHTIAGAAVATNSAIRQGFEEAQRRPLLRVDPAGVKAKLDEALASANRQAEELSASNAGGVVDSSLLLQGACTMVGIIGLVAAFYLKRKS